MSYSQEQLQSLLQKAEGLEHNARRRAIFYSLIPIIVAGVFILFTGWQIQQADQQLQTINVRLKESQQNLSSVDTQLDQTKNELSRTQQDLTKAEQDKVRFLNEATRLQKQLDDLSEQLRQASTFTPYLCSFSMDIAMKGILSRYPRQEQFWLDITRAKNFNWKLGGNSPAEGFDSPSFAAYILEKNRLLPEPASSARYRLQSVLPSKTQPQVGDVVFYQSGYTMFYFTDDSGRNSCVVGMTPQGILSLKSNFTGIIRYGKVF